MVTQILEIGSVTVIATNTEMGMHRTEIGVKITRPHEVQSQMISHLPYLGVDLAYQLHHPIVTL